MIVSQNSGRLVDPLTPLTPCLYSYSCSVDHWVIFAGDTIPVLVRYDRMEYMVE